MVILDGNFKCRFYFREIEKNNRGFGIWNVYIVILNVFLFFVVNRE